MRDLDSGGEHHGRPGLRISQLTLGTASFGGRGGFRAFGEHDVSGARRQIDIAVDAGVNLIDTSDTYPNGMSEEIIGEVMKGRWGQTLLSTKVRFAMGDGPNQVGLLRHHLIEACEASLRRLQTDHIDLDQMPQPGAGRPASGTSPRCMTLTSSTTRSRSSSPSPRATPSQPHKSRWSGCCARPGVTSVIIGARTDEQLVDNLAAVDLEPSDRPADLSLLAPYLED